MGLLGSLRILHIVLRYQNQDIVCLSEIFFCFWMIIEFICHNYPVKAPWPGKNMLSSIKMFLHQPSFKNSVWVSDLRNSPKRLRWWSPNFVFVLHASSHAKMVRFHHHGCTKEVATLRGCNGGSDLSISPAPTVCGRNIDDPGIFHDPTIRNIRDVCLADEWQHMMFNTRIQLTMSFPMTIFRNILP